MACRLIIHSFFNIMMIYRLIIYLFCINKVQKRSMKNTVMNLNFEALANNDILLYIILKMSLINIEITRIIYLIYIL